MRKWKPKCGEKFYYLSQCGTVCITRAGTGRDTIFKIATGNCFKSYRLAQLVLKKILDEKGLPYHKWGKIELTECIGSVPGVEKYKPYPSL